jgi:hypothetical protein
MPCHEVSQGNGGHTQGYPCLAQQHANQDTANTRITTALPNHTLRPKKANKHTYDDTLVHRKSVVSQNFTIFCRLEEHMSFCKKKMRFYVFLSFTGFCQKCVPF